MVAFLVFFIFILSLIGLPGCATVPQIQPEPVNPPGLDLHLNARPDERFHIQEGKPRIAVHWQRLGMTYTKWTNIYLPNGEPGEWTSFWVGNVQTYWGNVKCDATRTQMGWNGELGQRTQDYQYIMTTTPKEMRAVRYRKDGPKKTIVMEKAWRNMGGI